MKQAEEIARLHQQLVGRAQEVAKEGEKELVKQAEENARLHQQLRRAQEASIKEGEKEQTNRIPSRVSDRHIEQEVMAGRLTQF